MIYFEDYNFAFLHINKAGGTSVKNIFKEHWGEDNFSLIGNTQPNGAPKLHEPLDYKMNLLGRKFKDLKILTTVRNPYARWVSLHSFRRQKYERGEIEANHAFLRPFDKWLGDIFFHPQLNTVTNNFSITRFLNNGKIPPNLIIIRLEDLAQKLPEVLKKEFDIHIDMVPHENKSEHAPFMSYYDHNLRQLVYDKDKWLFDNFYPDEIPNDVRRLKLLKLNLYGQLEEI